MKKLFITESKSIVEFRLIDERSKPAVVAFGMYTLMNLLEKRTWIAQDLKLHIEKNMAGSLPSFRAAGKKVLKAINKTK